MTMSDDCARTMAVPITAANEHKTIARIRVRICISTPGTADRAGVLTSLRSGKVGRLSVEGYSPPFGAGEQSPGHNANGRFSIAFLTTHIFGKRRAADYNSTVLK